MPEPEQAAAVSAIELERHQRELLTNLLIPDSNTVLNWTTIRQCVNELVESDQTLTEIVQILHSLPFTGEDEWPPEQLRGYIDYVSAQVNEMEHLCSDGININTQLRGELQGATESLTQHSNRVQQLASRNEEHQGTIARMAEDIVDKQRRIDLERARVTERNNTIRNLSERLQIAENRHAADQEQLDRYHAQKLDEVVSGLFDDLEEEK